MPPPRPTTMDCFASLAMTTGQGVPLDDRDTYPQRFLRPTPSCRKRAVDAARPMPLLNYCQYVLCGDIMIESRRYDGQLVDVAVQRMNIRIEWQKPIKLAENKKLLITEKNISREVLDKPAVYFFSRKFGNKVYPFYIGETLLLRTRLIGHLKSKAIADALRGMKVDGIDLRAGARFFHYGYFIPKQRQKPKKCISIVQKYLIREALVNNVQLLNSQLTRVKTDSIEFEGPKQWRSFYPKGAQTEVR